MKRADISAYLVTNPTDYFHLIGFSGEDSAVLILPREVHIVSDGRFDETIKHECPWATKWLRKGLLSAEIGTVVRALKLRSMAVQTDHLTVAEHDAVRRHCKLRRLVAAPSIVGDMRRIKDASELATMRQAIRVAEAAFEAMRDTIRIGQTELELAARLEYEMKRRGSTRPAFATIVAEGRNAAHPHAHPGRRKVKRGSALLIDWGSRVGGYCSDLTRMIFVGSMPPRIAVIYDIVLDAQCRAIQAVRPGARMCDVDAVARDLITDAGYGQAFNHGLGHGLGLDVHEPPSLSWRSSDKLKVGDVVTVEPGIYLPGVGGVRIEDDVLVTPTGHRVLSRLGKQASDAVIRSKR